MTSTYVPVATDINDLVSNLAQYSLYTWTPLGLSCGVRPAPSYRSSLTVVIPRRHQPTERRHGSSPDRIVQVITGSVPCPVGDGLAVAGHVSRVRTIVYIRWYWHRCVRLIYTWQWLQQVI